ncbi:MAG: FkbM family methyltransferase [Rhodospirillales bacterium]|nr:FkbM family methyltransferase [Rhodospirillales bacterium]
MSEEDVLKKLSGIENIIGSLNQQLYFIRRDLDGLKSHITLNGETKIELDNGIKFNIPNQLEDAIQRTILMNRNFYESELLEHLDQFIREDAVILDIGANIGNHTLYWLSHKTSSFVYAFEPLPVNFELLKLNIELNKLETRVALFDVGLSNVNGRGRTVRYDSRNRGGSQVSHDDSGELKLVTLDSLNIERKVDFIKIDIEGFEANVHEGAAELLRRDKPPIFIEIFADQYEKNGYSSGILWL